MDQHNIILISGVTIAVLISIYIIWGPSPYPKKKKGGIVGLVNLGSTCFLNTLLQALASCALFVEWLDQQTSEDKSLTSCLQRVLWILNGDAEADTHSPEVVLTVLKRHGWVMPAGEQDAHELFHCIVSTLQEENNKAPKLGSLSDALPPSDTLSQASDILEDPFESLEPEPAVEIPHDVPVSDVGSDKSGLSVYEDFSTRGDSEQFYSVDSGGTDIGELGDDSSGTLKLLSPKRGADADSLKRGVIARVGTSPPCSGSEPPPFTGLLASSLTCCACGHASSVRTDTFDSVSLSLGEAPPLARHTLPDLVRQFVRTEIVPDVHCEKCAANTSALKTYNFGKLPPCLCFHIARTAWHTTSRTSSKRDDHVDFPEYLVMDPFTWRPGTWPPTNTWGLEDMPPTSLRAWPPTITASPMLPGASPPAGTRPPTTTASTLLPGASTAPTWSPPADAVPSAATARHLYRLKSVVVHVGSVSSGHFLTFRRGPLASNSRHGLDAKSRRFVDSTRWYVASDESVQLSSMSRAMNSLAYMLFYEKCSVDIRPSLAGEVTVR